MAVSGIVTLLSDFGYNDTYVGQMKGVMLARCPRAVLVDLTHAVRAQAVEQGAFLLELAVGAFPPGTVHLAVVDPGVGSTRRALAVSSGGHYFVGPDNGLLSAAVPEEARPEGQSATVGVPPGITAFDLTSPSVRREPVSSTFHGRDLFAPAAAFLAAGGNIGELGPMATEIVVLPALRAERLGGGRLRTRVVHIDHFGNLVTACQATDLTAPAMTFHHARHTVRHLVATYADAPAAELVALVGSGGYVELAVRDGNAAERTGIRIGDELIAVPVS